MDDIKYDLFRFTGKKDNITFVKEFLTNRTYRRIVYYRKYQTVGWLKRNCIRVFNHLLSKKMTLDLTFNSKIGKGLLILHPYAIAFNSKCVVGDNCTILKGATIGNSKTGKVGAPVIGNNVYIGLNSSVVGG